MVSKIQSEAMKAFGNRQQLKAKDRRRLAVAFGPKMTRRTAWRIVKTYAMGDVNDEGRLFLSLVHAWLVLGDRWYEVVFQVTRAVKLFVDGALVSVHDLVAEVKRFCPQVSRRTLERRINALQQRDTIAFAA